MDKLKPCPVCGGKAKLEDWNNYWEDGTRIECSSCGFYIEEFSSNGDEWHIRAVKKWNTRVTSATKPNEAEICLDRAIAEFNAGMDDLMKQFDEVRKVIENMQSAYSDAKKEERVL